MRTLAHVFDMTYREAELYLCAVLTFLAVVVGLPVCSGVSNVNLSGALAFLIVLPMAAEAYIAVMSWRITLRSLGPMDERPVLVAFALTWCWFCIFPTGTFSAISRLRSAP